VSASKEVSACEFFSSSIPSYRAMVEALKQIRDTAHHGTARSDIEVRREVFQIAQRELVALGVTPYDEA